jgi:hypothetical protein
MDKLLGSAVGRTLRVIIKALMERHDTEEFVLSDLEAENLDHYYDLSIEKGAGHRVATLKKHQGEGNPPTDVIMSPAVCAAVKRSREAGDCIACGGLGKVMHDANKLLWLQCPICGGSGVSLKASDEEKD